MRRAQLLAIGAAVLLLAAVGAAWIDGTVLGQILQRRGLGAWAAPLLLLSAVAGLGGVALLRRDAARLAARLRSQANAGALAPLEAAGTLLPLTGAVNELLAFTERSLRDAEEKARAMDLELRVVTAQRRHAEAIIHSISDAVLVTNRFGELVLANESAAEAFGFRLDAAGRKPLERVLRDEAMIRHIRDMSRSRSVARRVVEHPVDRDGEARLYKATLCCVHETLEPARAEAEGVVAVLHDMTRERDVAQMKNDFVSHVSHELRTPLASIRAYTELLIDGEADDARTRGEFYAIIQNEADRLGRLIDNILNISRIESGLVQVHKQPLSLTVVVKEALEVIAPQAAGKGIALEEDLAPVLYQTHGDRDMLYQATLNLLSNAVKYTPEGGRIVVTTRADEATGALGLRVRDSGVGIAPKDLPHVFDKFFRVHSSSAMAKGTGLGLSLVKQIVETVHQGKVSVESREGEGSVFGFDLPLSR